MNSEILAQNWALAVASVFSLAILLFVMARLYDESGQGRFGRCVRELKAVRKEARNAKEKLSRAEMCLQRLEGKAASLRPRLLADAEEALQDARSLVDITGDQVMRAEKILRDVILEEFPPNRQDVLRDRYL